MVLPCSLHSFSVFRLGFRKLYLGGVVGPRSCHPLCRPNLVPLTMDEAPGFSGVSDAQRERRRRKKQARKARKQKMPEEEEEEDEEEEEEEEEEEREDGGEEGGGKEGEGHASKDGDGGGGGEEEHGGGNEEEGDGEQGELEDAAEEGAGAPPAKPKSSKGKKKKGKKGQDVGGGAEEVPQGKRLQYVEGGCDEWLPSDSLVRLDGCRLLIKQGFVPNMRTDGLVFATKELTQLLLHEMRHSGGSMQPALKQVSFVRHSRAAVGAYPPPPPRAPWPTTGVSKHGDPVFPHFRAFFRNVVFAVPLQKRMWCVAVCRAAGRVHVGVKVLVWL